MRDNPLSSVFDLEDENTIFRDVMVGHDKVLHVDKEVHDDDLQRVVSLLKAELPY